MNRIDRLLALILQLQSQPLTTAEELADRFHCSIRTIYRDLVSLGEAGVPVVGQAGMGYMLARGYHLPPVSFTPEEASALVTGSLLARHFADESTAVQMASSIAKLRAAMPEAQRFQMVRLERGMGVTARGAGATGAVQLGRIQQALAGRQVLIISYKGHEGGEAEERQIEPLALIHYLERWHLIAWCRKRDALRDFRTDRIQEMKVQREVFDPRPDFSVEDYLASQPQPHLRAVVRFSHAVVDRVRREWWLGITSEQAASDGVTITLAAVEWDRLAGWLLTFGTEAVILEPGELRSKMVSDAKAIAAHHAHDAARS
ncbi:MAG: helix-turn-helix transcriptional regulator [Verrucomicrobium sp.]